ncbi:hypothetical protein WDZ92_23190 [Nostoc sp. NIES-2111]
MMVAYRAADLVDALDEAVIGNSRTVPDCVKQFTFAQNPIGMSDHIPQHGKRLWPKLDTATLCRRECLTFEIDQDAVQNRRRCCLKGLVSCVIHRWPRNRRGSLDQNSFSEQIRHSIAKRSPLPNGALMKWVISRQVPFTFKASSIETRGAV